MLCAVPPRNYYTSIYQAAHRRAATLRKLLRSPSTHIESYTTPLPYFVFQQTRFKNNKIRNTRTQGLCCWKELPLATAFQQQGTAPTALQRAATCHRIAFTLVERQYACRSPRQPMLHSTNDYARRWPQLCNPYNAAQAPSRGRLSNALHLP